MKLVAGLIIYIFTPLALVLSFAQTTAPKHAPTTIPLECAAGDCPLLMGTSQTVGDRSGFVRLKPGGSVGWHTTGQNEEALVILHERVPAITSSVLS